MPRCPSDDATLRAIPLPSGLREYTCDFCTGLWVPGNVVHQTIGATGADRLAHLPTARRLRCPDDGHALVVVMHRGVEIDICPTCTGAWLDPGERDKILEPALRRQSHPPAQDPRSDADIGEATARAIGTIFEFIGDALSGF